MDCIKVEIEVKEMEDVLYIERNERDCSIIYLFLLIRRVDN